MGSSWLCWVSVQISSHRLTTRVSVTNTCPDLEGLGQVCLRFSNMSKQVVCFLPPLLNQSPEAGHELGPPKSHVYLISETIKEKSHLSPSLLLCLEIWFGRRMCPNLSFWWTGKPALQIDCSSYATGQRAVREISTFLALQPSPAPPSWNSVCCPQGTPPEEGLKSKGLVSPLQDTQGAGTAGLWCSRKRQSICCCALDSWGTVQDTDAA